ncbi:MAG: hypothetical protein ABIO94_02870 [Opitutaceae bacterium]
MKPRTFICGCLFAIASVSAQPVAVPAFGPRFKQIRERADVMLGRRNGSTPPLDTNINLFQTPNTPTASPADNTPEPEPVGSDDTLLAEALVVLKGKVNTMVREGRSVVSVGPTSYREGESLPVQLRTGKINLRITRITANSVTLALNESVKVFRF